MKKSVALNALLLFALALLIAQTGWSQGQDKSKRASPPATATGKIGDATITINYSSPSVKGREIWGGLVPYGQVWRAGANEATIFETDKDIMVEGKRLPAGKYSLFVLPTQDQWQVIFNSETGQWGIKRTGEANRDPAKDVLTVSVKPEKSATMNEKLNYAVNDNGIVLSWENQQLPVSIK